MTRGKAVVWLHGEVKTPPFSTEARRHTGLLLREVQEGEKLVMPDSRPLPNIGPRIHELRVDDMKTKITWRLIYRIDSDAIVIAEVFAKKSQKTPQAVIDVCKKRYRDFDRLAQRGLL